MKLNLKKSDDGNNNLISLSSDSIEKTHSTHGIPITMILLGGCGFLVGILYAQPQDIIAQAQLLSGVVQFPADNPQSIAIRKMWTILNQIVSFFLLCGVSEQTISSFISGFIGMMFFQGAGLLVYLLTFSKPYALAFPWFFIIIERIIDLRANYEIEIIDTMTTNGTFSLCFIILTVALFCGGIHRIAAFMVGLSPSIHITWGMFLLIAMVLSLCILRFQQKLDYRSICIFALFGIISSLISYAINYGLIAQPVSSVIVDAAKYVYAFHYWDVHRQPISFFNKAFIINIFSIGIYIKLLKHTKKAESGITTLGICILLAFAIMGGGAAVASNFFHLLPIAIYSAMPARILKLNAVCVFAVIAGLSYRTEKKQWVGLLISVILCLTFISNFDIINRYYSTNIMEYYLLLFVMIILTGFVYFQIDKEGGGKIRKNYYMHYIFPCMIFILFIADTIEHESLCHGRMKEDSSVLEIASKKKGPLITCSNISCIIQLTTKRPSILYGEAFDYLPYAPEAAPMTVKILSEIYGVDYFNPPSEVRRRGGLTRNIDKRLWEERTVGDWTHLSEKYHFSNILTWADYRLKLPVVACDTLYCLYEIPNNTDG